ncbi:tRNA lysidine(34) synthetase TilS [Arcanobacterium phocae]|uniref:tRNA lysidine(34) synthetase TilS n=1 Tax=Arcanobacterium phocae TaxID=131112 RepID=UPI001C0EBC69|nr:tRNA lysidine(34) synthetase TilS [Arcanobacterium phocae]
MDCERIVTPPHHLVNVTRHAMSEAIAGLTHGAPLLLAVSGGSDSMAMAKTAAFIGPKHGVDLHAICVDHKIRPESAREAQYVAHTLGQWGVDVHIAEVDLAGNDGPEGNARVARYGAIAQQARLLGDSHPAPVFLGHTLNDQAETVMLGFGRGSGAKSIAGMPKTGQLPLHSDVPMVRPFLGLTRDQLRTVCNELGVTWVDDPSNELDGPWKCADGTSLRRSAVRHQILPQLQNVLGPGTVEAIGRTASMLQDDNQALEFYARAEYDRVCFSSEPVTIDCLVLADVPQAVRRRVLKYALEESGVRGGELVYWHIARLDKLVTERKNNCGLDLPGVRAWRDSHQLRFEPGAQSRHRLHFQSNPVAQAPMEDT